MKIKTSELIAGELDWAVAQAANMGGMYIARNSYTKVLYCAKGLDFGGTEWFFNPSTDWAHGGRIIEQEKICLDYSWFYNDFNQGWSARDNRVGFARGSTPLIAAMRCYVVAKLGVEIEIPEEAKCR